MQKLTLSSHLANTLSIALQQTDTRELSSIKDIRMLNKVINKLEEAIKDQKKEQEKLSEKQSKILKKIQEEFDTKAKGKSDEERKQISTEVNAKAYIELEPIRVEAEKLTDKYKKKSVSVELTEDEHSFTKGHFENHTRKVFTDMEEILEVADAFGIE